MYSAVIENFIRLCKENGLNVTYQRLAIYRKLLSSHDHPTAEDIFKMVKKDYPNISLATVYKTLETLTSHNLIKKVTDFHDYARYDSNNRQHHHLVCIKCKNIIDIKDESLSNLKISPDINPDFKILNFQIQINGVCNNCHPK